MDAGGAGEKMWEMRWKEGTVGEYEEKQKRKLKKRWKQDPILLHNNDTATTSLSKGTEVGWAGGDNKQWKIVRRSGRKLMNKKYKNRIKKREGNES